MTAQTTTPAPASTASFTPTQRRVLRQLRTRYQHDADLFSQQELARLTFLRWLYQTGRVSH